MKSVCCHFMSLSKLLNFSKFVNLYLEGETVINPWKRDTKSYRVLIKCIEDSLNVDSSPLSGKYALTAEQWMTSPFTFFFWPLLNCFIVLSFLLRNFILVFCHFFMHGFASFLLFDSQSSLRDLCFLQLRTEENNYSLVVQSHSWTGWIVIRRPDFDPNHHMIPWSLPGTTQHWVFWRIELAFPNALVESFFGG